MKQKLTQKQEAILHFISNYIANNVQSPTLADICREFGTTTRTVVQHLEALESKKFIYREKNRHRGIILSRNEDDFGSMEKIPVTSLIGCDNATTEGCDEVTDYILVSKEIKNKYGKVLAGRAVGFSMQAAKIYPGDVLLIKATGDIKDIKTGDIVVAKVDGNVLAKKIVISKETITLLPMSDDKEYKPLVFSKKDDSLIIIGRVVDVIANQDKDDEEIIIPE
jgi:SOS regulatory protein LexA